MKMFFDSAINSSKCCATLNHNIPLHSTSTESVNRQHTRRKRKPLNTRLTSNQKTSRNSSSSSDSGLDDRNEGRVTYSSGKNSKMSLRSVAESTEKTRDRKTCVMCRNQHCNGVDCVPNEYSTIERKSSKTNHCYQKSNARSLPNKDDSNNRNQLAPKGEKLIALQSTRLPSSSPPWPSLLSSLKPSQQMSSSLVSMISSLKFISLRKVQQKENDVFDDCNCSEMSPENDSSRKSVDDKCHYTSNSSNHKSHTRIESTNTIELSSFSCNKHPSQGNGENFESLLLPSPVATVSSSSLSTTSPILLSTSQKSSRTVIFSRSIKSDHNCSHKNSNHHQHHQHHDRQQRQENQEQKESFRYHQPFQDQNYQEKQEDTLSIAQLHQQEKEKQQRAECDGEQETGKQQKENNDDSSYHQNNYSYYCSPPHSSSRKRNQKSQHKSSSSSSALPAASLLTQVQEEKQEPFRKRGENESRNVMKRMKRNSNKQNSSPSSRSTALSSSSFQLSSSLSSLALFLISLFSLLNKTIPANNPKRTSSISSASSSSSPGSYHHLEFVKPGKIFLRKVSSIFLRFTILLLLVNFSVNLLVTGAYTGSISNSSNTPRLNSVGKVCSSMDIRNNPSEFRNLSDCSVIEGFLIISLMDKYKPEDYDFEFPKLREITDYMMVYRVNGLRSLGKLFPNLSVIRGTVLFEVYALVIYENIHLEEIALTSLTTIKRGAVRIEKNQLLCFVETINWSVITANVNTSDHFLKNNRAVNECPVCPGGSNNKGSDRGDGNQLEEVLDKCEGEYPSGRRYCWNRQHCQKICQPHCKNTCNKKGECCHESCLGGCSDEDVNVCSVCKHFVWGNECKDQCPPGSYQYLERSCVTKDDCFSKAPPLNQDMRNEYPFVPFRGVCSTRCPPGFEKYNNYTCRQCDDKCVKKCPSMSIDSILGARRLRGCTLIAGSLIISIAQGGPHIAEELESALGTIEEIEGYLKITRSYSLLSLSFLKNLKIIRGKELDSNKYALYILDNQNLQNIWGDNQTVYIEKGRLFFHFNPKLCYYKIDNLRSMMKENATLDKSEVATDSNGDRGACNITTLNVTVTQIGSRAVVVRVQPMEFDDERSFIGYQYYYIEAPHRNVSIYDSRHGCGNDGWHLDDDNSKETDHIFTHLKPFTQYAFYVKTYTISTERNNGQSNIIYFQTLPDKPEPVRKRTWQAISSSEIKIKWSPPLTANGNLTQYIIKANLTYDDPKLLDQRNYCDEPIKPQDFPQIAAPPGKDTSTSDKRGKDCPCDEFGTGTVSGGGPQKVDEEEVLNTINFEDALHNFIYVKREDPKSPDSRRKRDVANNFTISDTSTVSSNDHVFPSNERSPPSNDSDQSDETESKVEGDYYVYFYKSVNASTHEFTLKNLKHYSKYTISIKACRAGPGDNCSNEEYIYAGTAKKEGADTIRRVLVEVEATNTSRSNVRLKWDPPSDPNSLIVSYSIKYTRADIEHAKPIDICITQREYQNLSGIYLLSGLDTGNYSVQVMATSLSGDGNYTKHVYFYIPETPVSKLTIAISCLVVLLVIALIVVLVIYLKKKYLAPSPDLKLFTSVNPEYISMQYTPDEWEIARDKIIQLHELGQGSFGMVYEGIVKNLNKREEDTPCAIKTVNENATDRERINFLQEASVMKQFDTHHVVRLLGVVSRGQPVLVIMELMKNGDLKAYLRSHRPDAESLKAGELPPQPPTLKRILQMAIEIADGMAYLSAKKFVHRDLAARNCMVAADLTVKIGDFGMTRDIYETDYYRKGTKGLLPVRWMAPESLKDGVFSSATDVFSYGVVLWEMATLASQPYQGLSNDQVLRYVIDGGIMERPENCPDKLYNLMRKCWQHRPSSRPTFIDIIQMLLEDSESYFREVSFFHSPEGQDLVAQMQPAPDIDDVTTPLRAEDDDFKMEIEDNYLNTSRHSRRSHLTETEGQPRSPYSLGSAILVKNTSPDAVSSMKRSNQNNSSLSSSLNQRSRYYPQNEQELQNLQQQHINPQCLQDNSSQANERNIPENSEQTIGTTSAGGNGGGKVQNFIANSLGLNFRSRRIDFLRNAFLGNDSANNSNRNNANGFGNNRNIRTFENSTYSPMCSTSGNRNSSKSSDNDGDKRIPKSNPNTSNVSAVAELTRESEIGNANEFNTAAGDGVSILLNRQKQGRIEGKSPAKVQNVNTTATSSANDYYNSNDNNTKVNRKMSKDYEILNESIASDDATNLTATTPLDHFYPDIPNEEQLSLPSSSSLSNDRQIQITQTKEQENSLQKEQCNDDFKTTNLFSHSNNSLSETSDKGYYTNNFDKEENHHSHHHHHHHDFNKQSSTASTYQNPQQQHTRESQSPQRPQQEQRISEGESFPQLSSSEPTAATVNGYFISGNNDPQQEQQYFLSDLVNERSQEEQRLISDP